MTEARIERAFLTLPGRQVHYRRAGGGPAVVLLHQSPKSSEELIPMMRLLAPHFTVLAPDTPGYGLSDPIAAPDTEPEIDAFADAVAEFFDGMGLERAGVYGLHTGAAIGTRFAARYPERVAALVANGTLIKTPEERADFLAHYLPAFVPSWDGAHLAWAWSRMKEQVIFFPWHKRDPVARFVYPITLEGLQINLLALLQAGDNYRTAYRTAFSYAVEDDLRRLCVPACFVCAEPDPLFHYLDRFPPLPPCAAIARVADAPAALRCAVDFLLEKAADGAEPKAVPTAPMARRLSSRFVHTDDGQVHVRLNQDGSGRPIVVLHEPGGSARALQPFLGGFVGSRPVYAPEFPGHGDSDPAANGVSLIDKAVSALSRTLDALGIAAVDLITVGDGAAIGAAWAAREPSRIASLTLVDFLPPPEDRIDEFAANLAPDLAPDWAGGHLLTAWHAARDRDLFWPWFDKSARAALPTGIPDSDPHVQQRVIDLFKAEAVHAALAGETVRAGVREQLGRLPQPVHVFVSPERRAACGLAATELPPRPPSWPGIILAALDS